MAAQSKLLPPERSIKQILDWAPTEKDKVSIMAAEDGSGVGAALIAALTLKRVKAGNLVGIRNMDDMKTLL